MCVYIYIYTHTCNPIVNKLVTQIRTTSKQIAGTSYEDGCADLDEEGTRQTCIHIHLSLSLSIHIYMYMCIYACMCKCVYVYMYIHIHRYTCIDIPQSVLTASNSNQVYCILSSWCIYICLICGEGGKSSI